MQHFWQQAQGSQLANSYLLPCLKLIDTNPKNAELGLPSSYKSQSLEDVGLLKLAKLESDLCCMLLGAKALILKFKNANNTGIQKVTLTEVKINVTKEDLKVYWKLEKVDLQYLKDYISEDLVALGQGYETMLWIRSQQTESFTNKEDWQAEVLKVEWASQESVTRDGRKS
ncbi:hypothetical protein BDV93DRAFT_516190 [Ceratobasidium sp. AG-I]|nr:hypothetical protein BDV93DRAFT_516190 [Ceratobasidium sp. AG-I]